MKGKKKKMNILAKKHIIINIIFFVFFSVIAHAQQFESLKNIDLQTIKILIQKSNIQDFKKQLLGLPLLDIHEQICPGEKEYSESFLNKYVFSESLLTAPDTIKKDNYGNIIKTHSHVYFEYLNKLILFFGKWSDEKKFLILTDFYIVDKKNQNHHIYSQTINTNNKVIECAFIDALWDPINYHDPKINKVLVIDWDLEKLIEVPANLTKIIWEE